MKKNVLVILCSFLLINLSQAQTAKIITEGVSPHGLTSLGLSTNSVSSGLDIVPKATNVYLSAKNVGTADPITTATFTLLTKPAGSTAALTVLNPTWVTFIADLTGEYSVQLSISTAGGTHDTTKTIYAANFVGVGNFDGVAGTFPKCMTCHAANPTFTAIYDRWQVSGHATIFKTQINSGAAYYSTSCMKCHTTGYDHNLAAANNGFDDVAASLGWNWANYSPPKAGNWEALKTNFAGLVNLATIGCENCHGPGSEHSMGGAKAKIQISRDLGICAQCHDEPWRHNKVSEYENSLHAEALWSSSFAQGAASQNNNLQNCIRCHDANGFVNFTKGLTTNTTGMKSANHEPITCSACHDPHGNSNDYSLRSIPVSSDTLGNGYAYNALGGNGKLCMACHKARRDNVSYVQTNVTSSHWGPHHSVQGDNILGQNAATFDGTPFLSGSHIYAVQDACVGCHMYATADTGTVNRDKVGGHSFALHNEDSGYDHTAACTGCHGPKTSWEDFIATGDYDQNGLVESISKEIAGLIRILVETLPPVGEATISWEMIRDANDVKLRKAYWNYQLIAYDGSKGMHNPKFAVDVLSKSILAIGGVIPVELTSFAVRLVDDLVMLDWETGTETNNKGFEIERKIADNWQVVGYVEGAGTTTEVKHYSYTDMLKDIPSGAVIFYRLKQIDYDGSYSYSKEVEVTYNTGPKSYKLAQNYPNPFNPSTVIKFSLPYQSNVKLVIYNLTGEIVAELFNGVKAAGHHEVVFNTESFGNRFSSGVYLYAIDAASVDGSQSFKQTKKMVLVK
jgi:cytochrome c1